MNRYFNKLSLFVLTLSLTVLLAQQHRVAALDDTDVSEQDREVATGPNGGTLQTVGDLKIETVLRDKGIMFLVTEADGKLLEVPEAQGSLSLKIGDRPKAYSIKLQALKSQGIGAAIDLTKLKGKKLHMDVVLTGLGKQPIQFQTTGTLRDSVSDAMLISLQKTCPVTGKTLGSMGTPPKIIVQGKPLFVCCKPCSAKIIAKPSQYLPKYYSAKGKEVRAGVFEATLADATAIAAQKKCLVMDKPLGGMGAPQKVNVNGKSVFICCAGCAKKLQAEPEKYLAMLAEEGISPPDFK